MLMLWWRTHCSCRLSRQHVMVRCVGKIQFLPPCIWNLPFMSAASESIATLTPFGPIEGQKWFDQISSQWGSQKNRFAFNSFGKIQFLPPCIWNFPFMSYRLWGIRPQQGMSFPSAPEIGGSVLGRCQDFSAWKLKCYFFIMVYEFAIE